jgi:hypothetical protein
MKGIITHDTKRDNKLIFLSGPCSESEFPGLPLLVADREGSKAPRALARDLAPFRVGAVQPKALFFSLQNRLCRSKVPLVALSTVAGYTTYY